MKIKPTRFVKTLTITTLLLVSLKSGSYAFQSSSITQSSSVILAQQSSPISPSISPSASVNGTAVAQTNKQESIITTLISIISLVIATAVAYVSNFRKADIRLLFGRNIIMFSTPVNVSTGGGATSGVGFNFPTTFHNWSPQGGTVKRIRMVIGRQNSDDFYDMTWTTFVKIGNAGNFEDENLAQPIPVEGRGSVNKIIRFDWVPELGGKAFDVKVDNYELRIYGWTQDTEKPNLEYRTSFSIKDEHYQKFKDSVAANLSLSIWIPLDENEKPNQLVSRNTIDRLYSK